jgi:hypothetical protein
MFVVQMLLVQEVVVEEVVEEVVKELLIMEDHLKSLLNLGLNSKI